MKKSIISLFIIVILLVAGCQAQPKVPVTPGKTTPGTFIETSFDIDELITTNSFTSVSEFTEFVKSHESGGYYGGGLVRSTSQLMDVSEDMAMVEMSAPMAKGMEMISDQGMEYSETNVQVVGVDEADMLKTDGNYIYTISNDILYIIKAYPGEDAEIVATIPYEEDDPTSIFIDGDRMAVFGDFQNLDFYKDMDFRPTQGMTFFDIYDISDKSNPELLKEYRFEGRYFNGRMIDEHVYFVVRSGIGYRPIFPTPLLFEDGVRSSMPVTDIHYFNINYDNPQFITVHAIDINNLASRVDSTAVAVEYGQNLYMSQDNMYITYTQHINEWEIEKEITMQLLEPLLSQEDKRVVAKIKATDNDILNQHEKENKIYQIYMSYSNYMTRDERDDLQDEVEKLVMERLEEIEYFEYTVINKIKVNKGKVTVTDNGKVPGRILNQFSMDQAADGNFRIATTISGRWSRYDKSRTDSTNNVYVLDNGLKIIGELEGLAETEQIYSTRFIGDRLYMVTFRQVDPFFVIDLSNPSNPKELGKLKIPGFSRYLHPYDKDTIIGIGQDASETGRTRGLKISLFDVSDVEDPKEVAKFVTDERYAQSTALYEHKAFLFDREKELLVIPAFSHEYDKEGGSGYNGAFVFKINKDEITLRGLIDHSMAEGNTGYYRYGAQVERSLWINELLYTKSPTLLRINEIEDLSSIKNLDLTKPNTKIPIY